jgi:hypothetical protein
MASSLCVFFRQWQLLRPQHGLKQKRTRWCVHSCCSGFDVGQTILSSRQHYVRCLCAGPRQASAEAARGQAIQPSSSPAPHRCECPPSLRGCLTVLYMYMHVRAAWCAPIALGVSNLAILYLPTSKKALQLTAASWEAPGCCYEEPKTFCFFWINFQG